ncbi:MAG: hypothetical protein Q4C11_04350 [Clostridium sp.]|nr:hypothetical protein [Clostridium sp.]
MVVTIVVLLILAGVSISLVVDKNGIIQKSKDARREYGQAKANEQEDLSNLSDMIDEATGKVAKINVNTKASKNGTINGEAGDSNNPTIPKGYIPIDTATSTWGDGSTAPSQDSVNHGLVIKDEQDNEWVWVPVDKATLATMYEESSDEKTLCGTTGETAVTTNQYSKTITIGTDSDKTTMTRTTPGTSDDYREPDLVVGSDGVGLDAKDTYYKTILGETGTKEQLAQLFVDEYKAMIESVSKYGGFYIGRYELSSEGVQKDKATLTNTNWYNLYKKCKELNASDKVKTQMIWGCQWDITMNWLISSGAKTSNEVNKDSSSWGIYHGTSVKADDGKTELKASGTSAKLNTGKTTFTMANNIYDLAGNVWEWTQEANNAYGRAGRGGSYNNNGSGGPASVRNNYCPVISGNDYIRFSSYFNNKI